MLGHGCAPLLYGPARRAPSVPANEPWPCKRFFAGRVIALQWLVSPVL